jgi:hypothetical protein
MVNATNLEFQEEWSGKERKTKRFYSPQMTPDATANFQDFRLTKGQEPFHWIVQNEGMATTTLVPHALPTLSDGAVVQEKRGLQESHEVRPWVRYWARMIDCWMAALVLPFLLGMTHPLLAQWLLAFPWSDYLFGALTLFGWVFVEAALLSGWGSTPGKWLLRISVRDSHGQRLTFRAALERTLDIWWRGLALGIPLLSFFTMLLALGTLTRTGVTSWDARGGYVVTHGKIGWLRIVLTVLFAIGLLSILFWSASAPPAYETPSMPLLHT